MKRKVSIKVARLKAEGIDLDHVALALGGRVRRLNDGTWLDITVEDDPEVRERLRTRNGGAKRHGLPEGSPLEGMDEVTARRWAERHSMDDLELALGVSRATAYRRLSSGRLLPEKQ